MNPFGDSAVLARVSGEFLAHAPVEDGGFLAVSLAWTTSETATRAQS